MKQSHLLFGLLSILAFSASAGQYTTNAPGVRAGASGSTTNAPGVNPGATGTPANLNQPVIVNANGDVIWPTNGFAWWISGHPGNGAGLSNLTQATYGSSGAVSSNEHAMNLAVPVKSGRFKRPPHRFDPWWNNVAVGEKSSTTNIIRIIDIARTNGLLPFYDMIEKTDGWAGTNYINGHPIFDPVYTPNWQAEIDTVHSNGLAEVIYAEFGSGTSSGDLGVTNIQMFVQWVATNGLDGIRVDLPGRTAYDRLQILREYRYWMNRYQRPSRPLILGASQLVLDFGFTGTNYFLGTNGYVVEHASILDWVDPTHDTSYMGSTTWDDNLNRFLRCVEANYLIQGDCWMFHQQTPNPVTSLYQSFFMLDALSKVGRSTGAPDTTVLSWYRNKELWRIYNDTNYKGLKLASSNSTAMVFYGPLANGGCTVALINLDTNNTTAISVGLTNFALSATDTYTVTELSSASVVSNAVGNIGASVAAKTVSCLRLDPLPTSTSSGNVTNTYLTSALFARTGWTTLTPNAPMASDPYRTFGYSLGAASTNYIDFEIPNSLGATQAVLQFTYACGLTNDACAPRWVLYTNTTAGTRNQVYDEPYLTNVFSSYLNTVRITNHFSGSLPAACWGNLAYNAGTNGTRFLLGPVSVELSK